MGVVFVIVTVVGLVVGILCFIITVGNGIIVGSQETRVTIVIGED
jgi:hypothetical protein